MFFSLFFVISFLHCNVRPVCVVSIANHYLTAMGISFFFLGYIFPAFLSYFSNYLYET